MQANSAEAKPIFPESEEAVESWMTKEQFIGFLRGNAIKYIARCDDKAGIEDIQKARHYLDKLIETMK